MIHVDVKAWRPDPLRRFDRRPVYNTVEIERALDILSGRSQASMVSLDDDRLEILVESIAGDYDAACDLAYIDQRVEGATKFAFDELPTVMIDQRLSAPEMRRRRRMTVAHEIGHVLLHSVLFDSAAKPSMELFADLDGAGPVYCFRETIERGVNWMEWQASFAGGCLLMPSAAVNNVTRALRGDFAPASAKSNHAQELIHLVSSKFDVSKEAAEVRLLQLHYIESDPRIQSLPF